MVAKVPVRELRRRTRLILGSARALVSFAPVLGAGTIPIRRCFVALAVEYVDSLSTHVQTPQMSVRYWPLAVAQVLES